MKRNSVKRLAIHAATIAALGLGALVPVQADTPGAAGPPYGPMVNCPYAPAGSMGPGMMGGDMMNMMMGGMMGMGSGGMGGYGPGMMGGGMGMGPGMMGERMMGMGPLFMLNLSEPQRAKITKITDEARKQHWVTMGKIMEEQNRLRDLYQADTPDAKKIGAVYEAIARLQRQMIETHVQARNQAEQELTKEQRDQLRNWRRGMGGPGSGMGPGQMGPGSGPRGMGPGMMGQ